ncbi:MAG: sodium-dependent bicarbonate transport family permease [Burkholderiales bacterium]|nr:sodium-dependent bicarbonate transport family permease [Burkholderiales bacterium]
MGLDPVVLFFLLGVAARLLRSDLRLPEAMYEGLSIFLLLAIGLKGGVELARQPLADILPQAGAVVVLGLVLPLLAFPVLKYIGRLDHYNAAAIAAHYGSVSMVTFAVALAFLVDRAIAHEPYLPLFVVLLEVPGIIVGILIARLGGGVRRIAWKSLAHEVLFGRSILLLAGGLLIGWIAGPDALAPQAQLFFDLFKGVLALFMLEMGIVAAGRIRQLRRTGPFLIAFGTLMPMVFALIGGLTGRLIGLSVGGTMLLATLAASASYIAAPAAMRIAVPQANPALSLAAVLGVTFPFNVVLGVSLYYWLALRIHGL